MKELWAHVDPDKCFSFGRCMEIAPTVFDWAENGLSVGRKINEADLAAAAKAAESCPRLAIELVEIDGADEA
jgi:ferredoxin